MITKGCLTISLFDLQEIRVSRDFQNLHCIHHGIHRHPVLMKVVWKLREFLDSRVNVVLMMNSAICIPSLIWDHQIHFRMLILKGSCSCFMIQCQSQQRLIVLQTEEVGDRMLDGPRIAFTGRGTMGSEDDIF